MTIIAPSILAADPSNLAEAVKLAEAGGADWIHLDIMDGHFVPNLTYGPPVVKALRPLTTLPFDAHLMVSNPEALIPDFIDAGCDYIAVHQEATVHLYKLLENIKRAGRKAGAAINPGTPVETLVDVLPVMDFVVIMAVNPGYAGQAHIPYCVEKVRRFVEMAKSRGWQGKIQVDGGITPHNAGSLVLAGVDILVAGASGYRRRMEGEKGWNEDYATQVKLNISDLRAACEEALKKRLS